MALNPVLLAAMSDVEQDKAGLASGLVNTSFMMGGALGLAILASLASSRSDSLLASGADRLSALTGGYHIAFLAGAPLRSDSGRAERRVFCETERARPRMQTRKSRQTGHPSPRQRGGRRFARTICWLIADAADGRPADWPGRPPRHPGTPPGRCRVAYLR